MNNLVEQLNGAPGGPMFGLLQLWRITNSQQWIKYSRDTEPRFSEKEEYEDEQESSVGDAIATLFPALGWIARSTRLDEQMLTMIVSLLASGQIDPTALDFLTSGPASAGGGRPRRDFRL